MRMNRFRRYYIKFKTRQNKNQIGSKERKNLSDFVAIPRSPVSPGNQNQSYPQNYPDKIGLSNDA